VTPGRGKRVHAEQCEPKVVDAPQVAVQFGLIADCPDHGSLAVEANEFHATEGMVKVIAQLPRYHQPIPLLAHARNMSLARRAVRLVRPVHLGERGQSRRAVRTLVAGKLTRLVSRGRRAVVRGHARVVG
jgi:hypothetical protein